MEPASYIAIYSMAGAGADVIPAPAGPSGHADVGAVQFQDADVPSAASEVAGLAQTNQANTG